MKFFKAERQFAPKQQPILFLDFDGTVSERDVIDQILVEFADQEWLEIEADWVAGRIGSRECLAKQFELVSATPGELDEFLTTIKLDAGFSKLLEIIQKFNVQTQIVSDGFERYIKFLLQRHAKNFQQSVKSISVWANQLTPVGRNSWTTEFPYFKKVCEDGCATCKPAVIELVNQKCAPTIFVGDGLSDRYAAERANLLFAKKKLAKYCTTEKINFTFYENLNDVAIRLEAILNAVADRQHPNEDVIFEVFPPIVPAWKEPIFND